MPLPFALARTVTWSAPWPVPRPPVRHLVLRRDANRIGVCCYLFPGAGLASGDLYDVWTRIQVTSAADAARSRAILQLHLAALG
jgi:hypothetical protein